MILTQYHITAVVKK